MISLCLTNYNRYEMLIESFRHVYDDPRISEIVISDDCSKPDIYKLLLRWIYENDTLGKIVLHRNERNAGMSLNKKLAIERANNDWCILFDSDNVLKPDYLDAFFVAIYNWEKPLAEFVIFCPSFARPEFDYRHFENDFISSRSIKSQLKEKMIEPLLNTCNYIVNRKRYLDVYQHNPSIKASDTIHFNYLWLKSGGSFYVVPGMQYFHRVHSGSGFMADADYNLRKAEETKKLIMQL